MKMSRELLQYLCSIWRCKSETHAMIQIENTHLTNSVMSPAAFVEIPM